MLTGPKEEEEEEEEEEEDMPIHDCTNNCMYSFKTLLMMGVKSTRNM
jgi:hypothetical protein